MRLDVVSRIAGVAVALLIVACFSTMPAHAAGCKHSWPDEDCQTPKKSAKHVTRAKHTATREHVASHRSHRHTRSAQAGCRCKKPHAKWHGWVEKRHGVAFYHDGQRYAGGTRRGPATWYNNYEGGFNAAVYWKLSGRQGP